MLAEVMGELAAIKAELARRDELSRQMEAALLTIALAGESLKSEDIQ